MRSTSHARRVTGLLGIADRVAPQVPGRGLDEVRALLREEVERVCAVIGADQ